MKFETYLKNELKRPVNNDSYDANGNSERAVVTRGLYREIIWQYKAYPQRVMTELKGFEGLSTELGWFVQLPLMILLSPIAPILAAKHWHAKSLGAYVARYERSLTNGF